MRVLALDLSLTATGVALPDGTTDRLSAPHGAAEPLERLTWLRDQVMRRVLAGVDLVVLEGFSYGSKGSTVDQIYGLGWLIRVALHDHGITYVTVPPSSVKKYATGSGNAKKPDMRMELFKRMSIDEKDDNKVDALWLQAMALDAYGHRVLPMPQVNREALSKVDWPSLPDHEVAVA